MNISLILFVLSAFLANKSGFNFFFLLLLILIILALYLASNGHHLTKIKNWYFNAKTDGKTILQSVIITLAFLTILNVTVKYGILPEWITKEQTYMAGFFLTLYIPTIFILKLTFKVSIYLAIFLLILIPFLLTGKNDSRAEFFSVMIFVFLMVSIFQK